MWGPASCTSPIRPQESLLAGLGKALERAQELNDLLARVP
jgi:hypothetical protein